MDITTAPPVPVKPDVVITLTADEAQELWNNLTDISSESRSISGMAWSLWIDLNPYVDTSYRSPYESYELADEPPF